MRASPAAVLGMIACLEVLAPSLARSDNPGAAAPPPPAAISSPEAAPSEPPKPALDADKLDTVRLNNGSLLRGTLLEHTPGGRTVLLLHDGSQQSFEADAVAEVIPARQAPSSTPSAPAPVPAVPPPVQDGWVRLRVHTSPGFRLFARKGGDDGYTGICANDCETQLPAGPYEFQLRNTSGSIYDVDSMFDVDQSSRVDALLSSRRPARIAGGIVLGGGVLTGAILLGRGLAMRADARDGCDAAGDIAPPDCGEEADKVGRGRIIGGVLTALLSTIVGAILVSRRDQLSVTVEPQPVPVDGAPPVAYEPVVPAASTLRPVTSGPAFEEAKTLLRAQQSAIRACIQDVPASAELHISASGAIRSLQVYGDIEDTSRVCLREVLQKLGFAAGAERAVSIDIQPALR